MAGKLTRVLPLPARRAGRRLERQLRVFLESPAVAIKVRARLIRPYRRLRFQRFGAGSIVHKPEWLAGTHRIAIGEQVAIMGRCWLAAERQSWWQTRPALSIGDRVAIGVSCVITAAESVVLEEDVSVASHSFITDVHHTLGNGQAAERRARVTEINRNATMIAPIETAPVRIGRGTWLGKGVTVLHGSDIGEGCIIGSHSVVSGRIPDHSVVASSPARIVGSTRDA